MKLFLHISLLVCVAMVATSASGALTPFSDNFDSDTPGALYGQAAVTGQIWASTWGTGGLAVDAAYGMSSLGAGDTCVANGYCASEVAIPTPDMNSGQWRLSADTYRSSGAGSYIYLKQAGTNSIRFNWGENGDSGSTDTGVGMFSYIGGVASNQAVDAGFSTGWMHMDMDVNIDTGACSISWYDINNPTSTGAINFSISAATFDIDSIIIAACGTATSGGIVGFDNLVLTEVPEPATLSLLVMGSLLAIRRRKA